MHQVHDCKNDHKDTCGTEANNDDNSLLFPEYEIVIESDNSIKDNIEQNNLESERKEIERYNTIMRNNKAGTLQHDDVNDDLLQMANDETDKTFAEFRTTMDNYPDQILRCVYSRKK